ncbi:type II and III secretion system protein [bacterium]|jgi:hypothetical protein|nr:type II and III secretion system protein [bacterium]
MRKIKFLIYLFLVFSCVSAYALPRNISIEVEFKESGGGVQYSKNKIVVRNQTSSKYSKQFVVVSDGLTATIRVGEDVPFATYYIDYFYRYGYIVSKDITFKKVGTSLKVTPKIKGNYIEIELVPEISAVIDRKKQIIDVKSLSTTVIAVDGQSISIGGLIQDKDFSGTFFKSSKSSSLDIILTPRIMK